MIFRTIAVCIFLSVFITSCGSRPAETSSSTATSFVKALNGEDVDAMLALASDSVFVREQDWESSSDGYGFILGAISDRQVTRDVDLREAFVDLSSRVDVEREAPELIDSTIDQLAIGELSGIAGIWEPLDGYLFLRGMGDVEHIVLIGVGPKKKVQAIYIN